MRSPPAWAYFLLRVVRNDGILMQDDKYKKLIAVMVCVGCICVLSVFCSLLQLQNMKHMENRMTFMENMLLAMNRIEAGNRSAEEVIRMNADGSMEAGQQSAEADVVEVEQDINMSAALGKNAEEEEGIIKIYLTFDDGPSIYTDDILDILDKYGVKATFFVNGKEGYEEQYRRIVAEGHTLGMHSYSHDYSKVYADLDSFADDMYTLQTYLYELTGVECELYRFPGGSSNNASKIDMTRCIQYLNAKGIRYFDWNVSSGDASGGYKSADTIALNVMSQIKALDADTMVVLFHDASGKSTTVEALPMIIEKIQAMDDTELLPITDDTQPIQHISVHE